MKKITTKKIVIICGLLIVVCLTPIILWGNYQRSKPTLTEEEKIFQEDFEYITNLYQHDTIFIDNGENRIYKGKIIRYNYSMYYDFVYDMNTKTQLSFTEDEERTKQIIDELKKQKEENKQKAYNKDNECCCKNK